MSHIVCWQLNHVIFVRRQQQQHTPFHTWKSRNVQFSLIRSIHWFLCIYYHLESKEIESSKLLHLDLCMYFGLSLHTNVICTSIFKQFVGNLISLRWQLRIRLCVCMRIRNAKQKFKDKQKNSIDLATYIEYIRWTFASQCWTYIFESLSVPFALVFLCSFTHYKIALVVMRAEKMVWILKEMM